LNQASGLLIIGETPMNSCAHIQGQLLDYLYGLLDSAEAAALAKHLAECPSCRDAMARAEGQKRLLAAAARAGFPEVRFQAPPAPVAGRVAPPALKRPRRWPGLAAAAAVLLAVCGVGAAVAAYRDRRDQVALAAARVSDLRAEVERRARDFARVNDATRQVQEAESAIRQLHLQQQA
jgi:anti-sigma factor RsiW